MSESRRPKPSKHFLAREGDGSVRLRMRFTSEEASLFEEAAGDTPIMNWIHQALNEAAQAAVDVARSQRETVPPPEE